MKLDIILHYELNEKTQEMTYLGEDKVEVDTAKKTTKSKKSSSKKDENPEPIVTLDTNKLILTQGAVDLLQVCEDCRVDIKYDKRGKNLVPCIGTDSAFKCKGGNLLTAKNTIRYGGANNNKLASYGTTFKMEPTDKEGIYWLVGDKTPEEKKVPKELVNIESELDLTDLDNIEESTDVSSLDFTL
jgi:hypothetical protein